MEALSTLQDCVDFINAFAKEIIIPVDYMVPNLILTSLSSGC